jgi:heat shock protein HslJ
MMQRLFSIFLCGLAIAGCGEPSDRLTDEEATAAQSSGVPEEAVEEADAVAALSELPDAEVAGPTLYKAVGTEPGWSLTVRAARMDYAGDYGEVNIAEPTPPDFRAAQGTYRSGKLRLTISSGPCSDGMSDLIYRQTVRVTADGRTVSGCGGGTIAPNTLAGTSWSVVSVNGKAPSAGGNYFIQFSDKTLNAKFGCNSMGGGYRLNGDHLSVGNLIQTEMACPEPSMTFEREAGVLLRSNIRVEKIGGERLRLVSEAGTIELRRAI